MKNFKSLLLASVLFTSAVSFASEAPVAPKVDAPVENKDVNTEVKAPATPGFFTRGCNFVSSTASTVYNAPSAFNKKFLGEVAEGDNFFVKAYKQYTAQTVVVLAAAGAAYATYAYVTKTDKKAKN